MRLVMLGGTFNPPHLGHLKIAEAVRQEFGYEKLVLVPSFIPAHKDIEGGVSFHKRKIMTELSIRDRESAFVSDCEYRRKGVSYSIDTIRYLKQEYTEGEKPGLIIGDDLVGGFVRWHEAEHLAEEADIIICHRGDPKDLDFPFPHRYFQNTIYNVSSSEIRTLLKQGEDVSSYLVPSVLEYIHTQGLYGV
jgi:nicotinate-nucleotide adenylyltransferase